MAYSNRNIYKNFSLTKKLCVTLDKIGCAREYKNKNLRFYFDIPLVCTIFG